MKKKVFVVIYCDYGESCDGKPRLHGIYNTKDDAVKEVLRDMDTYIESLSEDDEYEEDRDQFSVTLTDGPMSCEWAIEEYDLDLN